LKATLDCIPCCLRQAVDTARLISSRPEDQEKIIRAVLQWLAGLEMAGLDLPVPPKLTQHLHRLIREVGGMADPYQAMKEYENEVALQLLPELRAQISTAADPLLMALRLAIAGNVIDAGVFGHIDAAQVQQAVRQALTEPFVGDVEDFRRAVSEAHHILYLADNAGEIVLDRLLIEQLSLSSPTRPTRVTVAVRGRPIINDATIADAVAAGIDQVAEVIDNGSDAPGTLLADCSATFRAVFEAADLVIAKGQGNFESLSDEPGNILFLLKAKCPVVANYLGVAPGTQVLTR